MKLIAHKAESGTVIGTIGTNARRVGSKGSGQRMAENTASMEAQAQVE